jgi:two-component system cell cycle sensor histidine kinase PleC
VRSRRWRDVSDRQPALCILLEKVELEHANRMKSESLWARSRELRASRNSVIGFREALKDGFLGDLTESQQGVDRDMFTSGQHLPSLINGIADLWEVEAVMMSVELEGLDYG